MKLLKISFQLIFLLTLFSCNKNVSNDNNFIIPNGDFEKWDVNQNLLIWKTNSCPLCVPPWETYILQQDSGAAHGQFAADFIYNNVYQTTAVNKFAIPFHPLKLSAYIKSKIITGDTAILHIDLFSKNNIVDSGNWYETTTSNNYRRLEIPITQTSADIDSAQIIIAGGRKVGTEFTVDNLEFITK